MNKRPYVSITVNEGLETTEFVATCKYFFLSVVVVEFTSGARLVELVAHIEIGVSSGLVLRDESA